MALGVPVGSPAMFGPSVGQTQQAVHRQGSQGGGRDGVGVGAGPVEGQRLSERCPGHTQRAPASGTRFWREKERGCGCLCVYVLAQIRLTVHGGAQN